MVKTGSQQEEALAKFWRRKAGLAYCDFDRVCGVPPPPAVSDTRPAPLAIERSDKRPRGLTVDDAAREIAHLVIAGDALSFAEYYTAVGFGFMRLYADPDGYLDYTTFFKTRWHQTATHKGYSPARACARCAADRKARRGR